MSPPWLKLIRHHHRRNGLGLTFPFLIGALREPIGARFPSAEEGHGALVSLLTCFRDEVPDDYMVRIFTCPDLGQPVATVVLTYWHPSYANWGVSRPQRTPLSIDPPYLPEQPADLRTAAQLLWPFVSAAIAEAKFAYSKKMKTYNEFNEANRAFIREALAHDEENEL